MKLTVKQTQALDLLEDSETEELLFGGGAGGGKSALGCYWLLKSAIRYPGSRWLMGRAKLKTLKETTLNTFFDVARKQGIGPGLYKYNSISGNIKLWNSSEILLKDLFYYPSDPEFEELGSSEFTGAFIDEASQITVKAKNTVRSRIRFRIDEFALTPKLLMTCNPSKNWVYSDFYRPSREGRLREGRAFVQSLLSDNMHIGEHYRKTLLSLDKASRERLLYGNWEYDDDPATLIRIEAIHDLLTNTHVPNGHKCITADIAMQGADTFRVFVWEGFRLIDVFSMPKSDGRQVEDAIRKTAEKHAVPQSRIVYDADGVGAYLRGYLKNAKPFVNGARPVPVQGVKETYKNLKSQCYFHMARRINDAGYHVACDLGGDWDMLVEELELVKNAAHGTDAVLSVLSKKEIKTVLGRSPDLSDTFAMREYLELLGAGSFAKYF